MRFPIFPILIKNGKFIGKLWLAESILVSRPSILARSSWQETHETRETPRNYWAGPKFFMRIGKIGTLVSWTVHSRRQKLRNLFLFLVFWVYFSQVWTGFISFNSQPGNPIAPAAPVCPGDPKPPTLPGNPGNPVYIDSGEIVQQLHCVLKTT